MKGVIDVNVKVDFINITKKNNIHGIRKMDWSIIRLDIKS